MPRSATPDDPPRRQDGPSRSHPSAADRRHDPKRGEARDRGRSYSRGRSSSPSRSRSRSRDGRRANVESGDEDSGRRRRHRSRSAAGSDERRHRQRDGEGDRDRDRDRESGYRHRDSRHRHGRSSRRSPSPSDDPEERERRREKRRRREGRETSAERSERKAARRAAKKAARQQASTEAELAQRAQAAEMLMYSAEDNPFNDANLGQKFTWRKKEERERRMGLTPAEAARRDAERRREAQEEIAKLNARRAEREREMAEREEEEARMARLAESAAMSEWVAKEDDFHLDQSRRRAAIRIRERRAKPIDLLAINLKWADAAVLEEKEKKRGKERDEDEDYVGLEIDFDEPYNIFESLNLAETEELHQDIQMYLSLEKNEQNLDFWRSMLVVCDDKLSELREASGQAAYERGVRSRVDPAVKAEMNRMLSAKSYDELLELQERVRLKLGQSGAGAGAAGDDGGDGEGGGGAGLGQEGVGVDGAGEAAPAGGEAVDVEYWEALLKNIIVWRAKAKLRDLHEVVLSNRLEYLRRYQRDEEEEEEGRQQLLQQDGAVDADEARRLEAEEAEAELREEQEKRTGMAAFLRAQQQGAAAPRRRGGEGGGDDAAAMLRREVAKGMGGEEAAFRDEVDVGRRTTYEWDDKYRPRKPRYFNRVLAGYEWNKYNQSHYDKGNPPPKVVQGYRFNIFYPDLVDKGTTPRYEVIREPGNDDTAILKFTAGPPYEDIAFRIVNKAWNMAPKRGFRSSFERGVLTLAFNFRRQFYRK